MTQINRHTHNRIVSGAVSRLAGIDLGAKVAIVAGKAFVVRHANRVAVPLGAGRVAAVVHHALCTCARAVRRTGACAVAGLASLSQIACIAVIAGQTLVDRVSQCIAVAFCANRIAVTILQALGAGSRAIHGSAANAEAYLAGLAHAAYVEVIAGKAFADLCSKRIAVAFCTCRIADVVLMALGAGSQAIRG